MSATALAVDLGSSGGRVLSGSLGAGGLEVREEHRFAHEAKLVEGRLVWDLDALWRETVAGLRRALERHPDAISVSVDTWGVDYVGLDAAGERVGEARCYRDERTERTRAGFRARLDDARAFAATGIAPAAINTANQLFAARVEEPELATRVARVLLLPDWFTYRLAGASGWSRSIASTTGLCSPGATAWSHEVFDALGLEPSWFGPLTDELGVVGPCQVAGLELLTVVRAGAHDTACAVAALPDDFGDDDFFLSCGSWSVLGLLADEPILRSGALEAGLTNEVRADGGLRPLVNITGLWTLQECQRDWAASGLEHRIEPLLAAAAAAEAPVLIDVDDPRLVAPGAMASRVAELVAERGARVSDQASVVRTVLESLAAKYAERVADLARLSGRHPRRLHVLGGGRRNELLLEATRRATGLEVVRGSAEASAVGSLLGQLQIMGRLDAEARATLVASLSA